MPRKWMTYVGHCDRAVPQQRPATGDPLRAESAVVAGAHTHTQAPRRHGEWWHTAATAAAAAKGLREKRPMMSRVPYVSGGGGGGGSRSGGAQGLWGGAPEEAAAKPGVTVISSSARRWHSRSARSASHTLHENAARLVRNRALRDRRDFFTSRLAGRRRRRPPPPSSFSRHFSLSPSTFADDHRRLFARRFIRPAAAASRSCS